MITPAEYTIITEVCHNLCRDRALVGDLIQEITLAWCEVNEDKQKRVRDTGSFKWWTIKTTKNQWHSVSSPFYGKYRKNQTKEWDPDVLIPEEVYDHEGDEMLALLEKHVNTLFPSEYNIIQSYYIHGMTIMQICHRFGVDKNFVWNMIKRVGRSIKRKMEWDLYGWNKEQMSELVVDFIGRKKLKIEERQIILDVHNYVHKERFNNVYDKEEINKILSRVAKTLKI